MVKASFSPLIFSLSISVLKFVVSNIFEINVFFASGVAVSKVLSKKLDNSEINDVPSILALFAIF